MTTYITFSMYEAVPSLWTQAKITHNSRSFVINIDSTTYRVPISSVEGFLSGDALSETIPYKTDFHHTEHITFGSDDFITVIRHDDDEDVKIAVHRPLGSVKFSDESNVKDFDSTIVERSREREDFWTMWRDALNHELHQPVK